MDEDAVVAMVRAADEQEGEIDEDARTHLSALELESLPSHTLAEPDGGAECSVCLAQMSGGQEVAPLACGHTFHRPCIVRWFARSCRCPYCRTPVPRASESGRGEPRGVATRNPVKTAQDPSGGERACCSETNVWQRHPVAGWRGSRRKAGR